ncbi:MAG: peptidylprolyl isomerase [Burkholderiales bacterium]
MKAILKEPLLHFLLIGAAIFLFFDWSGAGSALGKPRIVVKRGQVEHLVAAYEKTWHRSPSPEELQGLVDDWVREEIAVREATEAGLDRDDTVIRRRLRQRFEVIAEEGEATEAPTDAQLAAFLGQHADRFTPPAAASFEQIFLDGDSPSSAAHSAAIAKAALQRGVDPTKLGRASMLPVRIDAMRVDQVASTFGPTFARKLATLPPREWSDPVRSAYGSHLVRVSAYAPGALPPLDAVRTAVAREWENERRVAARAETYRKARERYDVVIEQAAPQSVAAR